jgi:hypothetical protein
MTPANPAQQAIQWLEQQLTDLAGIRNATPRDPSFKNWRQATLTVMQRIWPGDQERQERFRRIPFSPADPRADARTVREWYSRGCQEASRVLQGFVNDIRAQGVPAPAADVAAKPSSGEFGVDFPTVDLPSGDLGAAPATPDDAMDDLLRDLGPASGSTPRVPVAPAFQASEPTSPSVPHAQAPVTASAPPAPASSAPPPAAPASSAPPPAAPASSAPPPAAPAAGSSVQVRQPQPKKGVGARLRDLLGFAQIFQPGSPPPPEPSPAPPNGLEIIPVGDEPVAGAPGARATPPAPTMPAAPSLPPVAAAPVPAASVTPPSVVPGTSGTGGDPHPEPGMSVVMSRPTTLRGSIEKVSIESLISPEFRDETAPDPLAAPHLRPMGAPVEDVAPASAAPAAPAQLPVNQAPPAPVAAPAVDSTPASRSMEVIAPGDDLFVGKREAQIPAAPAPSGSWPLPTPSSASLPKPTPSQAMPAATPSQRMPAPTPSQSMPEPTPSQRMAVPAPEPTPSQSMPEPTPSQSMPAPTPSQSMPAPTPSQSMPAPSRADLPQVQPSAIIPMPPIVPAPGEPAAAKTPSRREKEAKPAPAKVIPLPRQAPEPVVDEPEMDLPSTEDHISREIPVDPEEFAQATEDFMRSSPVLGATGRKVKRGYDRDPAAQAFDDPDAIAVAATMDDLAELGVPASRHPEAKARLLDLARRIEKGEVEWAVLRKAVSFAMEYPELARRLIPILLPWIERAA